MAKKLLTGLSNAKNRTFLILFAAIIVIGVFIAWTHGKKEGADVLAKQGSQAAGVPSQIKSTPGSAVSAQYRELQVAENDRRAQEAMKKKTSSIPTIIGAISDTGVDKNGPGSTGLDEGLKGLGFNGQATNDAALLGGAASPGAAISAKSAQERDREAQEKRLREQREHLEKMRQDKENAKLREQELQRQRMAAEAQKKAYEESVKKVEGQMKSAAAIAYGDWQKLGTQQYVQGELAREKKKTFPDTIIVDQSKTTIIKNSTQTPSRFAKPILRRAKTVIKAGTVLYGVLETSVNSDENGPVLATIVAGKYRGGKLVGSLKDLPKPEPGNKMNAVVVQFSQLNLPKRIANVGVNVVAIDPDTARTALASNVDHHYLMRYGSLFASSFVQGYGKALASQGGTSTVSPLTGTVTTQLPPLNNSQIFLAALGELGNAWSTAIKPLFNLPPTVTVDQGTSIGLLFLSDVDVTDDL